MQAKELEALENGSIRTRFEGQKADRDYLRGHYDSLLNKYRNQWIVISGGKLIKSEKNPDRLIEHLSKTKEGHLLVFYLADPEEFMLL